MKTKPKLSGFFRCLSCIAVRTPIDLELSGGVICCRLCFQPVDLVTPEEVQCLLDMELNRKKSSCSDAED